MIDKKWTAISIVTTVISILMLLIPQFSPVCNGMVETAKGGAVAMKCHWTYQGEILISVLILVISLGQFVLKGLEARRASACTLIILSIGAIMLLQNSFIGICAKSGMSCHTTATYTTVASILLIIWGMFEIWFAGKIQKSKKGRNKDV